MNNQFSIGSTFHRANRQIRIWGEQGQEELHVARVLVNGNNLLSEIVSAGLTGLGIGDILIMGNTKNDFNDKTFLNNHDNKLINKNKFKADGMIKTLQKINPYINIQSLKGPFISPLLNFYDFNPDIIIDTENDEYYKKEILSYICANPSISFLSSYTSGKRTSVSRFNPQKENYEDILNEENVFWNKHRMPGIVPSCVSAGIILEQVCNELVFDSDKLLNKKFNYNLDSSNRTSKISNLEGIVGDLSNKKALIVGAGGIGTYAALNLTLSGFSKIDILDYDEIDETNLNRQILFYEKVGQPKAKILSERITKFGKIKSKAFYSKESKIDENSEKFFKKNKYDVIFGCLDNTRARYLLNQFAIENKTLYIDGGTSALNGNISPYIPGKTPCISCQKNLKLEEEKRNSCSEADSSVIMPNMIIGALMVGEAMNILSKRDLNGQNVVYNPESTNRIYTKSYITAKQECNCSN